MNRLLLTILLTVLCLGLFAQWSTDPFNPTLIYGLTGAQVIPKTAITDGGYTWIAWMDNTTGNYNTYLQQLDPAGTPVWTNPLLVSDNATMTWLTEWDMDCDSSGNAILCFQDIRLGTNNVVIYKISPTGMFLWGNDGIMLSNVTSPDYSNMSPTVLCLEDGRTIAAWQYMGGTTTASIIQSITSAGVFEWGPAGLILTSTTESYTWPQLLASGTSNVLVKYYGDTGPFYSPTRHILVQKYNSLGNTEWTNPTIVQGVAGIEAWQQKLSIVSDEAGGMVIVWHEDRNATSIRYTYIQHVLSDGTVSMPANGSPVSLETGVNQFYPKVAFEPVNQEAYVFWNRVSGNQDMWGLQMQKLNMTGDRLWAGDGIVYIPMDAYPTYPLNAFNMQNGVVLVYTISPEALNDQLATIKAFCVGEQGQAMWDGGYCHIAATSTLKLHYDSDNFTNMWGVVAWEDGGGPSHTYAMRFNYNGTLGTIIPAPYNLTYDIIGENTIQLNWEFPDVTPMPIAFKVYRNDELINQTENSSIHMYEDVDVGPGLWSYHVTALYAGDIESEPSNEVAVNVTLNPNDPLPIPVLSVSAYPNPFRDNARLVLKGINPDAEAILTIYNLKGQQVQTVNFTGRTEADWLWDGKDSISKPVSPGVYFVRIANGKSSLNQKLVKF